MKRTIRLNRESYAYRPAFDTAVSRALLHQVSDGDEPETLRLYRPSAIVAFGPQDILSPGYHRAVKAARGGGFEAVRRLSGGRAAIFHQETIAFAWAIPDPSPQSGIRARYEEMADIMVAALRKLGVDARLGEVAGEYCPGSYSVNAGGKKKLVGSGQRLITRASHIGGVVVVRESQRVRDILLPVYNELEVKWDPATVGSIEDELPSISYEEVERAILEEFAARYDLFEGKLATSTLALAETLEAAHVAP